MYSNTLSHYKTIIRIPFGELDNTLKWCNNNLKKSYKFDIFCEWGGNVVINNTQDLYCFSFSDEVDYSTFLFWKK